MAISPGITENRTMMFAETLTRAALHMGVQKQAEEIAAEEDEADCPGFHIEFPRCP